jgi:hypothetical protein
MKLIQIKICAPPVNKLAGRFTVQPGTRGVRHLASKRTILSGSYGLTRIPAEAFLFKLKFQSSTAFAIHLPISCFTRKKAVARMRLGRK